jgi:hypothetical protein
VLGLGVMAPPRTPEHASGAGTMHDPCSPRATAANPNRRFRRAGDAAHAARFKARLTNRADVAQRRSGRCPRRIPLASRLHNGAAPLLIAHSATSALAGGLGADGATT